MAKYKTDSWREGRKEIILMMKLEGRVNFLKTISKFYNSEHFFLIRFNKFSC